MTYNVHGCVGTDGQLDHVRIADVIASGNPDVVALQELDAQRVRSGGLHQARVIAELLGMGFHFHPAMRVKDTEEYGDALLSKLPLRLVSAGELPTAKERLAFEPRGALWASVSINGVEIQIINTHLGLGSKERRFQIEKLLGAEWLAHPDCVQPTVFCGDLNALPGSAVYRSIRQRMRDTQHCVENVRPQATFPSRYPMVRLDYIFISDDVVCRDVTVVRTPLARVASDHLPVVADLAVRSPCHEPSVVKSATSASSRDDLEFSLTSGAAATCHT